VVHSTVVHSISIRPGDIGPSFRGGLRQQLLQLIKNLAQPVHAVRLLQVAKDPDDDKFLECAGAARADYPVTGNQRHFPKFWKKTKVITSRELIGIVAPHLIT
jgi:uncharacterized protein